MKLKKFKFLNSFVKLNSFLLLFTHDFSQCKIKISHRAVQKLRLVCKDGRHAFWVVVFDGGEKRGANLGDEKIFVF